MRNPKGMYQESELSKIYFDFLSHKNAEVQKLALQCIMSYKHKYLTPYRDSLFNLVDDKNFKDELTNFRVDQESSTVQDDHRKDLIPVVMQIVFSKMSVKTGLRTGGKSSGQLRRNLVLRFLSGCKEEEMFIFIERAFKVYSKHIQDDAKMMVDEVCEAIDLEKFVPPKRLQSSVNLLSLVFEHFGGLMSTKLHRYLVKVLLVIGAMLKGAFGKPEELHGGYLPILRNLRASCLKVLENFFAHFDGFPWESQEIDAVFDAFVWPYVNKLAMEGIHSPTVLLKLFITWGSIPKYFPLLVKHVEKDETQYVLEHLVRLLMEEKCNVSVYNAIMEMLEKLLKLQKGEEEKELPIENLQPIQKNILDRLSVDGTLNYGSCILLPYASKILEKIKLKLAKGKSIGQRELFIVSRISELVWEADISDQVLHLMVPIILKRCHGGVGEEVAVQFLTTVSNLLSNVEEPRVHLKSISPLFSVVAYASARKLLCQILHKIVKRYEDFRPAADLIEQLNAWDAKWLDQPDFEKRHEAFKLVNQLCGTNAIDVDLGVLVIYNCYYMLSKEKDLSLKENASHCFKLMAPCLVKNHPKEVRYVLDETLFGIIRGGLRNKNDDIRNECISLLGCVARECPEAHPVLQDLNKFTNKTDLEVDCFENLTHMQLHRHVRALVKFSQILRSLEAAPNIRTLTQFLLPLTTFYLCTEKYAGKNSLIDAAIEALGVVCRLLPWHQYEGLLKYYLKKLRYRSDHQKQLVRLTVAMLDAFHYDLSKGQVREAKQVLDEAEKEDAGKDVPVVAEEVVSPEGGEATEAKDDDQLEGKEDDEGDLEVLDEAIGDEVADEVVEDDKETLEKVLACQKTAVLCKSAANRVIRTIQVCIKTCSSLVDGPYIFLDDFPFFWVAISFFND